MRREKWIYVVLALVTAVLYLPVRTFGFVNMDDFLYVTENPDVQKGLSWPGVIWAFKAEVAANWHPLTLMSHMLDCQIYGANAGGHHLTSVLFHIANTLLVFALLRRMTGAVWRSAAVAALFGWHPMHVESVAWISERKDVLCGFFWLLATWTYVAYADGQKARNTKKWIYYALTLVLLACALMSKPMAVTFPFTLLLLDYWPLKRISNFRSQVSTKTDARGQKGLSWLRLGVEKIPFFVLTVASCVITYVVQRNAGAVFSEQALPLGSRVANVLVSYGLYVFKLLWPVDLAALYPFQQWQPADVGLAMIFLLVITGSAVLLRREQPALLTGWLWFLGTLVPVIGLVQVGNQSMADRYTYLPSIGFFMACVWGVADALGKYRTPAIMWAISAGAGLVVLCLVTERQINYWRDDLTLFQHTVDVTENNWVCQFFLGKSLLTVGRMDEGLDILVKLADHPPNLAEAQSKIGMALMQRGKAHEAIQFYYHSLTLNSNQPIILNNLAWIRASSADATLRNGKEAVELAQQACELSQYKQAFMIGTLGAAYAEAGRFKDAVDSAELASRVAKTNNQPIISQRNKELIDLYREGKPYHEAPN